MNDDVIILKNLFLLMDEDESIRESARKILDTTYPDWRESYEATNKMPNIIAAFKNPDPNVRIAAWKELNKIDPEWSLRQRGKKFSPTFFYAIRDDEQSSTKDEQLSNEIADEFANFQQKINTEPWNINKDREDWDSNEWEGLFSIAERPYDEE